MVIIVNDVVFINKTFCCLSESSVDKNVPMFSDFILHFFTLSVSVFDTVFVHLSFTEAKAMPEKMFNHGSHKT